MRAIIHHQRSRIVQFIARRNQPHRRRRRFHVPHIRLPPSPPRGLRHIVNLTAPLDDLRHRAPEAPQNLRARDRPALIFNRIVQQRRNRFILAAAMLSTSTTSSSRERPSSTTALAVNAAASRLRASLKPSSAIPFLQYQLSGDSAPLVILRRQTSLVKPVLPPP